MAIVLARLFLVLALVFVSLLAIILAWELSWHRSRLCVTRGMSLVVTRVIAVNDAELCSVVALVHLTSPDYLRRVGIFRPRHVKRNKITQEHNSCTINVHCM